MRENDRNRKRSFAYGVEAVVKRDAVLDGTALGTIDLEQLFIFMVKGEQRA